MLLFDFDGTLFDTEGLYREFDIQVTQPYCDDPEPFLESLFGLSSEDAFKAIIEEFNLPTSIQELLEKQRQFLSHKYLSSALPVKGALEFIHRVKTLYPLAIVTNSEKPLVNHLLKKYDLLSTFEFVLTIEEVAKGKPAPDIYLKAKEIAQREIFWVFEDSPSGVKSALQAELKVILIGSKKSDLAHHHFADFGEIPDLLLSSKG